MTRIQGRILRRLLFVGIITIATPILANTETGDLAPVARHEKIGQLVTEFIQKSHYRHAAVDDDLSSKVFDYYIEALDSNRMYLLEADVQAFELYRHRLDDMVRSEPLNPVFDMFDVYRTRVSERLQYAMKQIEAEPDFTVDESYEFDRETLPWATTKEELDKIWRKRVKNDALSLALADKEWSEIQEILDKRYSRFLSAWTRLKATTCSKPL